LYRALLCIYVPYWAGITDSAFENNSFVWLVGASLEFARCYFDKLLDAVQMDPHVILDNCRIGPDHFFWMDHGCVVISNSSHAAIIAIVAGAAALIVIVVIGVVCLVKKRKKSQDGDFESLRTPLISARECNLGVESPVIL
jgi:hypothetical protein